MGPSGPAREGSGILRVRKPPFAETELGAKHCPILSSFLVPRRSRARSFCFLEGKPPLSYGAWVGSSDRVLQSVSSPTTCFMRTLRTKRSCGLSKATPRALAECLFVHALKAAGRGFSLQGSPGVLSSSLRLSSSI